MSERRLLSVEEVQERLQHGWHVSFALDAPQRRPRMLRGLLLFGVP